MAMAEMTYLQAISEGLREEMRADETVFCLGEDIGAFGGAFKITDGFIEEFGEKRVWDTPLAENAIIGAAVGCAIEGMKPVAEMQFADFIACGFDQLVNVAAKMHYRQGVAVPMVMRLPSGGGFSGGPFHSQNPEAWFMQSPGLKIVAPSTAEDAKGLIAAAIQDPNPVVYMEHKHLYRRIKGEVAALIAEEAWEDLDGPVTRVSAPDVPIPFSPPLERAVLPQVDDVREACRELLAY